MVYQTAGWKRVSDDAGFYPEEIGLEGKDPVIVEFDNPIAINENGYIYIWISNQSKETRVWFDDLKVTHTQSIVVQATDYGVWGDVLREQKTDESVYRFGYQGQFAEKDEETGWNHFELREYDPIVGRWTIVDPKRIGWSPYIGMYNNPVSGTDPDGGGPGDDMDFEYAEAMRQMDINLYDQIRLSGASMLEEISVQPSGFDYAADAVWAWAQLYEPELYLNFQYKQTKSNGNSRVVIPLGVNFTLDKGGFRTPN